MEDATKAITTPDLELIQVRGLGERLERAGTGNGNVGRGH
jgi:hypothetical protein